MGPALLRGRGCERWRTRKGDRPAATALCQRSKKRNLSLVAGAGSGDKSCDTIRGIAGTGIDSRGRGCRAGANRVAADAALGEGKSGGAAVPERISRAL